MPRCYFFNIVETPTFVTTAHLSEKFRENPKCGYPEKNDNGLRMKPFLLGAVFQHLRPRSGSQTDQPSTSVPFINKISKIQISKIWILIAQKGKRPYIQTSFSVFYVISFVFLS